MKISVHCIVKGYVQGVGYRYFAMRQAEKLQITGYVRNLANGDVEVFAEGEEEDIEQFVQELKKGPAFAHVQEIEVTRSPYEHRFDTFSVKF